MSHFGWDSPGFCRAFQCPSWLIRIQVTVGLGPGLRYLCTTSWDSGVGQGGTAQRSAPGSFPCSQRLDLAGSLSCAVTPRVHYLCVQPHSTSPPLPAAFCPAAAATPEAWAVHESSGQLLVVVWEASCGCAAQAGRVIIVETQDTRCQCDGKHNWKILSKQMHLNSHSRFNKKGSRSFCTDIQLYPENVSSLQANTQSLLCTFSLAARKLSKIKETRFTC